MRPTPLPSLARPVLMSHYVMFLLSGCCCYRLSKTTVEIPIGGAEKKKKKKEQKKKREKKIFKINGKKKFRVLARILYTTHYYIAADSEAPQLFIYFF